MANTPGPDSSSSASAVAESIFTGPDASGTVRLLISRCHCGAVAFPQRSRCAACSSTDLTIEPAPSEGTVFSWTTMPGSNPQLVVGLVKLANGITVQGYVQAEPAAMAIDLRVRSVAAPIPGGDDPGYAFEVVGGGR